MHFQAVLSRRVVWATYDSTQHSLFGSHKQNFSPSYHVQRSTGCLHWSILQGSLKRPGSFCNVFLPLSCSSWTLEPRERFTFFPLLFFPTFFFLFPFVRPSIHQSNQLTKSCMDFLSFIFWSKNMIMITVQTEINALREMKGVNFDS
ncbi:hypothetical protein K443DRAFT_573003 [Laccaria amethystina LaAM-08-1]|uniref:Uncharacterized protein n=1 Tax=Laccaria amethystina LaAM-08-1 TaxID=1095629 RepID=A0A0C9WRT2_9AGAR|nr:hypothetical protein K443DRAFT_573003 [Laccaria amethystina LaAM-08-1]